MLMSHKQLNLYTTLALRSFGAGCFNEKEFFIFVVLKEHCNLTYRVPLKRLSQNMKILLKLTRPIFKTLCQGYIIICVRLI